MIMPQQTNARILEELSAIKIDLAAHYERDNTSCRKLDDVYRILVTGNGNKPITEQVHEHEDWINDQKEKLKEKQKTRMEIVVLVIGQIVTLAGTATAIAMGLKP